jgi:hypothetical protein
VCPTDRPDDSAAAHKHAGTDRRASGHCPDDAARGGDKQDPVLVGDNDASHRCSRRRRGRRRRQDECGSDSWKKDSLHLLDLSSLEGGNRIALTKSALVGETCGEDRS